MTLKWSPSGFAAAGADAPAEAERDAGPSVSESMQDVFDIYTIIFLALAVFIFMRLRSVLGQRTGRERPPFDPYSKSARDVARPGNENVVTLPNRTVDAATKPAAADKSAEPAEPKAPTDRWKGFAASGSPVAAGFDAIVGVDPTFDAKHFVAGARAAYEMIVTAFADGDRRTLKSMLSREVFDGFDAAITDREKRGDKMESRFVGVNGADVTGAELRGRVAHVSIRFNSQLISVTRNKDGAVIDGNPEKVTDVTDSWTFARDVSSRDPNWKLVATEPGQ